MLTVLKKKQFWGALIAIALLGYCVKDVRISEIQALSQRLNFWYVIPALLSSFLFQILRGLRWRLMISHQTPIRIIQGASLYAAGQVLNTIMPVLTGQVGRMILFARKTGLRKTFIFSNIVLEVLFDAVSLIVFLLITSLAFAFPDDYRSVSYVIVGVTGMLLILLYLILQYRESLEELGTRWFRGRWPGFYITLKKFLRSFTKGIELLKSSQHMAGTLAYSLSSWFFHVLVVYFLFKSFGIDLDFAVAAAVMIINSIVLMIPITPGNAGTFEVAVSTVLAAFAVGRSDAVLFALALHLIDLLPIFILGLSYLHYQRISIKEFRAQEEAALFDHISEDGTLIEEEKV
ncbi:flippase-like domain-containing protein [bacterium]|nr:flippase-like domain-containing protein [bacterium]